LRLKILKKLRTASLNSEFTGSYEKCTSTKSVLILGEFINENILMRQQNFFL